MTTVFCTRKNKKTFCFSSKKKTLFGSTLLFISLCQGKGSLGWPQAEIAHSALLYEVPDSIGIRSEFPARAEAMFTPERGRKL